MFRKPIFAALGFALLLTSPVLGQTTQTLTQGGIESNFLIAPDYKFTEVDGEFAGLAGFYGGWLINQKFLVGGAAYFQTNGGNESDMKYGGAVLKYFFNPTRVANISVRGLVGAGRANLSQLRRAPSSRSFSRSRQLRLGKSRFGEPRQPDRAVRWTFRRRRPQQNPQRGRDVFSHGARGQRSFGTAPANRAGKFS